MIYFSSEVYGVYMTTIPTTRKIATAARRLLDREGADALTMRRIAKAVGITPMAVYRHYQNRASLLNALADEGFAELTAELSGKRFSGNIEKRLMEMADIYLDHALESPRLFELMFLQPREGARKFPQDFKAGLSPTANLMVKVIDEGMKSGYFREDDAWEIVFEMGALSHGLIMLYLGGRMSVPAKRFRAVYRRSFRRHIHGIRK
jgi:AcrR family transcriptional regulator